LSSSARRGLETDCVACRFKGDSWRDRIDGQGGPYRTDELVFWRLDQAKFDPSWDGGEGGYQRTVGTIRLPMVSRAAEIQKSLFANQSIMVLPCSGDVGYCSRVAEAASTTKMGG
jgi:hypothetical protein